MLTNLAVAQVFAQKLLREGISFAKVTNDQKNLKIVT